MYLPAARIMTRPTSLAIVLTLSGCYTSIDVVDADGVGTTNASGTATGSAPTSGNAGVSSAGTPTTSTGRLGDGHRRRLHVELARGGGLG